MSTVAMTKTDIFLSPRTAHARRAISLFTLTVLLCLFAAGACLASKADDYFADADKAIRRAKAEKTAADRKDDFDKALKAYSKVESAKMYSGTAQQAEALYRIALLRQDMSKLGKKDEEKKNLQAANEALKRLLGRFGKPEAELSLRFETADLRQVLATVAKAKELKKTIGKSIDTINSRRKDYRAIDFFVGLTGRNPSFSYWFAIVLITFLVKFLMTPLTKKQFQSMKEMQRVAPLVKEIQAKYKGDQKTIGEKTMDLYKEHNINPFASCLPLLVQMPILWLLYSAISSYEYQFAKGTFLWIGSSLSHLHSFNLPAMFSTASGVVWFTARNLAEPDILLVILYVISMYVSTKLSSVDPTQAEQQKMMAIVMPVMFAFLFAGFPAAFLLYWLTFNVLQTAQQYLILKPSMAGGNGGGGSAPTPPAEKPSQPSEGATGSSRVRRRRRR